MRVEVLKAVPDVCQAEFLDASRRYTINGRCSRVRSHRGQHFDAILGFVWSDRTPPRAAWRELDASDLAVHFDCHPHCPWSPREC